METPIGTAADRRRKVWLPYAIGAAVNFFAGNSILSTITMHIDGLATIFYVSAGAVFCGALHMVIMSCNKGKWHDQNLLVKGTLSKLNVLRFLI